MNNLKETRAFFASFQSTERLIEGRNTDALFVKEVRASTANSSRAGSAARILGETLKEDWLRNRDTTCETFGNLTFQRVEEGEYEDFMPITESTLWSDDSLLQPRLNIHFWPSPRIGVDEVKSSMTSASGWLAEVSGEYPRVYGCTYDKLAGVAFRLLKFEEMVEEENSVIDENYRRLVIQMHRVYSRLNNLEIVDPKLACIAARTSNLADSWRSK